MIIEWYAGFHKPCFRNLSGRIDPRLWLGHCEIWGYSADKTWLFIDPSGEGTKVRVMQDDDDILDQLAARYSLCASILRITASDPAFRIPVFGALTCASFCGHVLGVRALLPSTLRRKLRVQGAEVIHEAQREPGRQSGAAA